MRTNVTQSVVARLASPTLLALAACSGNKYTEENDLAAAKVEATFFQPAQVTAGNESNFAPDLSPNGVFVVYTSDRKGNKDIWEKRAQGGFARPLTLHSADDFAPVLSPDGDAIAFVSRRDDAAGDIHILNFGFTFDSILGASEGNIVQIGSKSTEDLNPSWYPNGEKVVFAARKPGEKLATLMTAELKDQKAVALGEAKGDQPSVAPDGQTVAFVKNGAIMLFHEDGDKITQVTEGGAIQDGQPRFTQDSKGLVFVRYADDTNNDGKLDGDDRPTVWRLDLAMQKAEPQRDNYKVEPLTAAKFGAFTPQIRSPFLYLALQTNEGLDIFRLPESGQIAPAADIDVLKRQFDQQNDPYEKTYVLRRAQAAFARQSQETLAAEAAILEIDWHVQNNRRIEAEWSQRRIRANFADKPVVVALADLAMAEQDLSPLAYPKVKTEHNDEQKKRLGDLEAQVDAVLAGFKGKDAEMRRVVGKGQLVKAKILAAQRKFFQANDILASIPTDYAADKTLVAEAGYYAALITPATSDVDAAIKAFQRLIAQFPEDRLIVRRSSEAAVEMLAGRPDYVKDLGDLLTSAKGLPALPALAHLKKVEFYLNEGKRAVAANELRQIVDSYPESTALTLEAAAQLIPMEERTGRFAAAEEILTRLNERVKDSKRPENRQRARELLLGFWLRRGEYYLKANEPALASKEYRKVTSIEPWNVSAHRGLLDSGYRLKKIEELQEFYERLANEDPMSGEKAYIYGYSLTFDIDAAEGMRPRLAAIDTAIEEVEKARLINAQILQIHQTLGWLYLQKGFWLQKYYDSGSVLADTKMRFGLFRDFFGAGDPNWLELAIDAFQTGFFLSEDASVEQAGLAQNLGQAFYELNNFQKSLNYYMRRIKLLPVIPTRDARTEGVLWRRAGRSAFQTEELALAETLQKSALAVWEKINDETEIGYSLDALGLTLRDRGDQKQAIEVYERLLKLHERQKQRENIAGSLSNLGYCHFMAEKFPEALEYFERAEKEIAAILAKRKKIADGDDEEEEEGEAKQVDLGGQGSAAKGFDLFARQNLIVSFKARIYGKLGRYDLALATMLRKHAMLKEQRDKLQKEEDKPANFLAEELAITQNNIAAERLALGDHWEARRFFKAATETARLLRAEGQKFPTDGESKNSLNAARVDLRLASLGILPVAEIEKAAMALDATVSELRPIVKEGAKEQTKPLATALSLASAFRYVTKTKGGQDEAKKALEESLSLSRKFVQAEDARDAALYAYAMSFEGKEGDEELASDVSSFREELPESPELEWKVLAAKQDWEKAFEALDRHVLAGGDFESIADRNAARTVFENLIESGTAGATPERVNLYLRRYLLMRHTEAFLREMPVEVKTVIPADKEKDGEEAEDREEIRYTVPKSVQRLLSLKEDTAIAGALRDGEAVVTMHRLKSGKTLIAVQTTKGVKIEYATIDGGALDKPESYASALSVMSGFLPPKGGRLYLVPSAELWEAPWEDVQVEGARLEDRVQLAFLPTIDALPQLFAQRMLGKLGIGHVAWTDSGESIKAANTMRDYELIKLDGSGHVGTKMVPFNLVHIDAPTRLNDVEPGRSIVVASPGTAGPTDFVVDMTMKQLVALDIPSTMLVVYANVQRVARDLDSTTEGHDGWAMLSLASAAAGASTIVTVERELGPLPGAPAKTAAKSSDDDDDEAEDKDSDEAKAKVAAAEAKITAESQAAAERWKAFYAAIDGQDFGDALRASGIKGRVLGYAGIPASEQLAYAKANLEELEKEAEEAADDGELGAQANALKKVYYFQTLLKDEEQSETLKTLVLTYNSGKNFVRALHYKKKIAAILEKGDDPEEYGKALFEAATLAVNSDLTDEATRLLDEAEKVFTAEKDDAQLGKIYKYRGIVLEKQKRYDDTIAAYKKSRELFMDEDAAQAAGRLLDIGNVYRNDFSDFRTAFQYYDEAAGEFKKLGKKDEYIAVAIDRANTLKDIGQLETAIASLTHDVIPAIDVEEPSKRIFWVRAHQALAASLFRAGSYQEALDTSAVTIAAAEKLERPEQRTLWTVNAIDIRAQVAARLGNPKEAFAEFRRAIAMATEFKLRTTVALLYNNYGTYARDYGDPDRAIEFINIALGIDRELKSKEGVAYDQRNLALAITVKGDLNGARDMLLEALKVSEELKLSYNAAYCYFGLGDIFVREKKWKEAEEMFAKALDVSRKGYMQDFIWRALAGVGRAKLQQGEAAEGTKLLAESVAMIEGLRAGLKADESRNGFMSDAGVQEVYESYVVALMADGKGELAWTMAERARSRAFIDSLGTQKFKFSREQSSKLIEEEKDLRAAVDAAESRGVKADIDAANGKYQEILSKMRSTDAQLAQFVNVEAITRSELGQLLPAETALVQYASTPDKLFIWVIQGGKLTSASVDVTRQELSTRIRDFRTLIQNFSSTEYLGKELASFLVTPVQAAIAGAKRLVIVPHGALHFFPFAALPVEKEFLADRAAIYYLDSATMARFTHKPQGVDRLGKSARVIAFANPTNEKGGVDLPFAGKESAVIGRYFPKLDLLEGSDALESKFKANVDDFEVVHVASHGEFRPSAPGESRLFLAPDATADGNLSVNEIFGMATRADLVTLSACESGLGKISLGDEVIGMHRAFLFAGASTVVSSLWRISDVASAVTMKRFYRYLSEGQDKAEAMRQAQQVARKYFPHPANWAGFRVVGDYR